MTASARLSLLTFAFAALLLMAVTMGAGRAEATISTCSVTSTSINFSPYNTITKAAVDSTGTVTVQCTGTGNENLRLELTGGSTGQCSPRRMTNGAPTLAYQVYRNAGRTQIWCDGSDRINFTMSFGSGATLTQNFTMYGRVTANQNPSYGTYADTLTMTLKQGGTQLAVTSVPINGSVAPVCSVSAATLGFGTYTSATGTNGSANISVNCSNGAPYQVSLGGGLYLNGGTRRMRRAGPTYLSYELYSDSNRTIAWGDGSALGAKVSATGSGSAQSRTVYGRVPPGQAPTPGSYSDSVVVTVEY